MRYTLRLLTAQQFQRAAALVCAAELARREDEATWGSEPFRIGLWVGTDVSARSGSRRPTSSSTKANEDGGAPADRAADPALPVVRHADRRRRNVEADGDHARVFVYCGDELAECPFAEGGPVDEGLPVLTVDEEIYRLAPAFVHRHRRQVRPAGPRGRGRRAVRLRRAGAAPGTATSTPTTRVQHARRQQAPRAQGRPTRPPTVQPVGRLRPPDLIIQDELHLITGALGTAVGLFEVAVDVLSSWTTATAQPVRPLIVASTATVATPTSRCAASTAAGRRLPAAGARRRGHVLLPRSADHRGAPRPALPRGLRPRGPADSAEIRVAEVLLLAGQLLFDRARRRPPTRT